MSIWSLLATDGDETTPSISFKGFRQVHVGELTSITEKLPHRAFRVPRYFESLMGGVRFGSDCPTKNGAKEVAAMKELSSVFVAVMTVLVAVGIGSVHVARYIQGSEAPTAQVQMHSQAGSMSTPASMTVASPRVQNSSAYQRRQPSPARKPKMMIQP